MAKGDVVSVKVREESPQEVALAAWFTEQESKSVDNLEAAARQLIQLVTAFYGVLFGIISLGSDSVEASLSAPVVLFFGALSILALLAALLASLVVIAPLPYRYRTASLTDQKAAFETMLSRKANGLLLATVSFGLGLVAFVALIFVMLYLRG